MRFAQNIVAAVILFASISSQAAVTITGVTGASNFIAASGKIFGGTAGSMTAGTCPTAGTTNLCDSCLGTDFSQACNKLRINQFLAMVISITADKTGKIILTNSDGQTAITVDGSSTINTKGPGTLQVSWGTLCGSGFIIPVDASTASASCEFNGNGSFRIGTDNDGNSRLDSTADDFLSFQVRVQNTVGSAVNHADGCASALVGDPACSFGVLPGDEKAYVVADQVDFGDGYPLGVGGINYTDIRFYFKDGPFNYDQNEFAGITRAYDPVTLPTSGSGDAINLGSDIVDNLVNGSRYYFLMASVDEAKNEGFYSNPTTLTAKHSALPNEVFGLLSNDFQCFVATAAYGTPMMKEVVTLRRFRGYLLDNYRAISFPFIKFYYKVSPPLGQFIARHDSLRAVSRALLWPAVLFAKSSLTRGLPTTLFISVIPILLFSIIAQLFYRRRKTR